jgi:ABC-2 type transport system permease protein
VHQLGAFGKYPITIYSLEVQVMVVVVIPFDFVSFFPVAYLFNIEAWSVWGLLAPLVAVYSLIVAVWAFRVSLRRYESTGH